MKESKNSLAVSYGLFFDLSVAESIKSSIRFETESSFDIVVKELRSYKPTFEVGIKQPNGEIETITFEDLKLRIF